MLHSILYWAGWVFELTGLALVALMAGESLTEGAVHVFRVTAAWLVFVFLAAAMVHACGWVMQIAGAVQAHEPAARFTFIHMWSHGVSYWLAIGAVFAPLLLWIPGLRTQPQAVLTIALIAVTPWVRSLVGY